MSGLFSILNIANRGMAAQQTAINVTSHNIANSSTEGYSRQRAVIETTRPSNVLSLNSAFEAGQLGTGAQVEIIQRVRDSFLDYQVRVENSTYGQFSARDEFLSQIENIINEPSDTGISTLIGNFFDSWHVLSADAQSSNSRTIVVNQSQALADELNHTANQLNKLKENSKQVIMNTVFEVNDIIEQIDKLNQQIMGVKIAGQEPNDLMDKRDKLLDDLSIKLNITIDKNNFYGLDIKTEGINIVKSENNTNVNKLSYVDEIEKIGENSYKITYYKFGNKSSDNYKRELILNNLSEEDLNELETGRIIWTDYNGEPIEIPGNKSAIYRPSNGELMGCKTVFQDVENYMDQLDKIAKALAFTVNALHSNSEKAEEDTLPFFVNGDIASYTVNSGKNILTNIADVLSAEKNITAANISINKEIVDDVMKIKTAFDENGGENEGTRALAIAQLRNNFIRIQDIGSTINSREDLFNKGGNLIKVNNENRTIELKNSNNGMKIDDYFKDIIDRLGVQGAEAKRMVANQESLLESFKMTRESVSGVSIDEEMANLIQYQHAYAANAKIIATVDQLLDVVINGLIR
ncbi:flagellar hook-associated protein 1 FlgK [Clostridium sp. USBA 49]|uniref:flagellar hook-associated protein FlgK n=1 Tax=Clostridium sp. USBA 49 TaxID=1881060 RepID=UPI00099AD1F0|nr:flagellar hook-associated protein FlgK [Clostridium sp. USBA 49]SKA72720.1 flagellar hook-associated protein 1 FlgK [Clostridium sp. USBA 49]